VVFRTTLPNARVAADKVAAFTPVPLNPIVCGDVEELSFTLRVPVLTPKTVGENVTEILQLLPAASVSGSIGHSEVSANAPEAEMLLMVNGTARVLVRVTASAVLVVWTTQSPKNKVVSLRV
jgi:hypothetical protein